MRLRKWPSSPLAVLGPTVPGVPRGGVLFEDECIAVSVLPVSKARWLRIQAATGEYRESGRSANPNLEHRDRYSRCPGLRDLG